MRMKFQAQPMWLRNSLNLKKQKTIDGEQITGWFTEDLTYAQIKTLKAKERLASRSQEYNGKFSIPSFAQILAFVKAQEKATGRRIGIYPELKHPTYFNKAGFDPEKQILADLSKAKFAPEKNQVFIQCFETTALKWLAKNSTWPLVQLLEKNSLPYDMIDQNVQISLEELISDKGLEQIRTYADGIGPDKRMIIPVNKSGELQTATDLVQRAHHANLIVHPYTFRSDKPFLSEAYQGNPDVEYEQFFRLGVDGLFSDFTDHAVRARRQFYNK